MGVFQRLFGKKAPAQSSGAQARRASQLLDQLVRIGSGAPSAGTMRELSTVMDRFTQLAQDTRDPAVVEVLLGALNHQNPGVRGLAIQSLGLVYDPRALDALAQLYPTLGGDHRQRAAASIANLVLNRDKNPKGIAALKVIARDKSLPIEVRAHAVMALCGFRRTNAEAEGFLTELANDPSEEVALKVAAM